MTGEYDAVYENYIDGLHREIIDYQSEVEQVKGENAKLVMKLNAEHIVRQNVERENAKLRELVRDMWGCISHIGEYDVFYYDMAKDGCGISCTVNGEHCCADKLHYRMRELGVDA